MMQVFKVNTLYETGFLRQSQILGHPRLGIPGLIPVSATTWWTWVRKGKAPQPMKLGPALTVWRVEDIRALIVKLTAEANVSGAAPTRGEKLATARQRKKEGGKSDGTH